MSDCKKMNIFGEDRTYGANKTFNMLVVNAIVRTERGMYLLKQVDGEPVLSKIE